jgi:hypothetical protein
LLPQQQKQRMGDDSEIVRRGWTWRSDILSSLFRAD